MELPGGWELILIAMLVMVLFGAKRLPEAARSLGRSIRIFKAETQGLREDAGSVPMSGQIDSSPPPVTPPRAPKADTELP